MASDPDRLPGLALTLVNLPLDRVQNALGTAAAEVNVEWERDHFLVENWPDAPLVLGPLPIDEFGPFHGFAFEPTAGGGTVIVANTSQLMRIYEEGLGKIEGCVIHKIHWHARAEVNDEVRSFKRLERGDVTRAIHVRKDRRTFEVLAHGPPSESEPGGILEPARGRQRLSRGDLATIAANLGVPLGDAGMWKARGPVVRIGEGSHCTAGDLVTLGPLDFVGEGLEIRVDEPDLLDIEVVRFDPPTHIADWLSPAQNEADGLVWLAACPCGSRGLTLASTPEDAFPSALLARCPGCDAARTVHDGRLYGHDARIVSADDLAPELSEPVPFGCADCGGVVFMLTVAYQIELDADMVEAAEGLGLGLLDLYHWVSVSGECAGCGMVAEVLDAECA